MGRERRQIQVRLTYTFDGSSNVYGVDEFLGYEEISEEAAVIVCEIASDGRYEASGARPEPTLGTPVASGPVKQVAEAVLIRLTDPPSAPEIRDELITLSGPSSAESPEMRLGANRIDIRLSAARWDLEASAKLGIPPGYPGITAARAVYVGHVYYDLVTADPISFRIPPRQLTHDASPFRGVNHGLVGLVTITP